jgi:hypothetical protein
MLFNLLHDHLGRLNIKVVSSSQAASDIRMRLRLSQHVDLLAALQHTGDAFDQAPLGQLLDHLVNFRNLLASDQKLEPSRQHSQVPALVDMLVHFLLFLTEVFEFGRGFLRHVFEVRFARGLQLKQLNSLHLKQRLVREGPLLVSVGRQFGAHLVVIKALVFRFLQDLKDLCLQLGHFKIIIN